MSTELIALNRLYLIAIKCQCTECCRSPSGKRPVCKRISIESIALYLIAIKPELIPVDDIVAVAGRGVFHWPSDYSEWNRRILINLKLNK